VEEVMAEAEVAEATAAAGAAAVEVAAAGGMIVDTTAVRTETGDPHQSKKVRKSMSL
jgi:hypothetical protein